MISWLSFLKKKLLTGGLCSSVFCGQGTCNNIDTLPGFECNCYDGWNKIQIGPLTFPSCLIPNCEFLSLFFLLHLNRYIGFVPVFVCVIIPSLLLCFVISRRGGNTITIVISLLFIHEMATIMSMS